VDQEDIKNTQSQEITKEFDWAGFEALHTAFFFNKKKYVTIQAGRRVGKTYGAFMWLIQECLENVHSGLWVDTAHNNIILYVDLYLKQGTHDTPPIIGDIWYLFDWDPRQKILKFPNGSFIRFGSAERPQLLEGLAYSRVVLNEAGIILKNPNLWDNVIAPMTKGNETQVRIVGTPKGKNKFHTLTQNEAFHSFHITAYQSPHWDTAELDMIKDNVPVDAWQQEYLGQFLDNAAGVFRNIKDCYLPARLTQPIPGRKYGMSVDLAKHKDYTVIYVADIETRDVLYQLRFNQLSWTVIMDRIEETFDEWGCEWCIVDSQGVGDVVFDNLEDRGMNVIPFRFSNSSKNHIIDNLSVAIDKQDIRFYPFESLIKELEVFEYEISPSGNKKYNAPSGFHDDCVISLALLNEAMRSFVPRRKYRGIVID